jgi:hypothetical protein
MSRRAPRRRAAQGVKAPPPRGQLGEHGDHRRGQQRERGRPGSGGGSHERDGAAAEAQEAKRQSLSDHRRNADRESDDHALEPRGGNGGGDAQRSLAETENSQRQRHMMEHLAHRGAL